MSLSKGVALVTGASRGIGRAIALRLAHDGYALALNDTPANRPAVAALKAEIEKIKYGGGGGGGGYAQAVGVEADVTDEEQVKEMVRKTVEELGSVDVMVANAGILKARPSLVETSMEDFDETFAVNVRGVFLCYKYAAQQMIAQHQKSQRGGAPPPRGASIIGAASVTSKQAWAGLSAYSASKWAVRGLTQASALELAPYGIRVNAYAPGLVDTKMVEKIAVESNREHAQYITEESRNIPLKRLGAPDDVADLVSFLVSDKASYITGQSVSINGGAFFD
ncbi:NAD(P)-binding domain superfamily protein [Pleurotus pulmonarius]